MNSVQVWSYDFGADALDGYTDLAKGIRWHTEFYDNLLFGILLFYVLHDDMSDNF